LGNGSPSDGKSDANPAPHLALNKGQTRRFLHAIGGSNPSPFTVSDSHSFSGSYKQMRVRIPPRALVLVAELDQAFVYGTNKRNQLQFSSVSLFFPGSMTSTRCSKSNRRLDSRTRKGKVGIPPSSKVASGDNPSGAKRVSAPDNHAGLDLGEVTSISPKQFPTFYPRPREGPSRSVYKHSLVRLQGPAPLPCPWGLSGDVWRIKSRGGHFSEQEANPTLVLGPARGHLSASTRK